MSALLTAPQMRNMARASKYAGLTQFDFTPRGTDLELECWMEFEPAERGSREHGTGLQMEPDYPASATLCYCEVNGEDIAEILSESTKEEIEAAFLSQEVEA